jgi:hypothetical protein
MKLKSGERKHAPRKRQQAAQSDTLRPEYKRSDFGEMVPGKYTARTAETTNVVMLDPAVAKTFPNDQAVNNALRIDIAKASTRPARWSRPRSTKASARP